MPSIGYIGFGKGIPGVSNYRVGCNCGITRSDSVDPRVQSNFVIRSVSIGLRLCQNSGKNESYE